MRALGALRTACTTVLGWIDRHGAIFLVVGVVCLSLLGWTVHEQQGELRRQRVDSIATTCEELTERNHRTTAVLDEVLAHALKHASPAQRLQIRVSRVATILLIDALAPIEDCGARVFKFTGEHLSSQTR